MEIARRLVVALFVFVAVLSMPVLAAEKTQDVAVVNVPTVNVATLPVPEPFFVSSGLLLPGSTSVGAIQDLYTVPKHRLLVIEHVSAHASVPAGQYANFKVQAYDSSGTTGEHDVLVHHMGSLQIDGSMTFVGSHALKMYVKAGETIRVFYTRPRPEGFTSGVLNLTGYFLDVP
jgi:hypothetical protein